ncbi:MAG: AraC family transcriptional regulator [Bacteroidota bacterium]
MSFGYFIPRPELRPYVRYYWTLDDAGGEESQSILPTGCMQLILNTGERFESTDPAGVRQLLGSYVGGQHTSPFELSAIRRIRLFAIVFRPHGARLFFDEPASEFSSNNISIEMLKCFKNVHIEEKLSGLPTPQEQTPVVEEYLLSRLKGRDFYDFRRIGESINIIDSAGGNVRIKELAGAACLSAKQFERKFGEYVGLAPKSFRKIVRFQTVLHLQQTHNYPGMTELGLAAGYYDQSHFINDFKSMAGMTPARFFRMYSTGSDYFAEY